MKKLIFSFALTLILAFLTLQIDTSENIPLQLDTNKAYASDCTECSPSTAECHRVIVGNHVYIFHGDASPCGDDQ